MSIQDFKSADWGRVKNFTRDENWGDPDRVNASLVYVLDALRNWLGFLIHLNHVFKESGHSPKSQHYKGNAADFWVESDLDFERLVRLVERFLELFGIADKVGFGVYPAWRRPGFHLDVRGKRARWGAIPHSDPKKRERGEWEYVSIEAALEWRRSQGGV